MLKKGGEGGVENGNSEGQENYGMKMREGKRERGTYREKEIECIGRAT